jgi:Tfp pilus assembly protein PilO
MTTPRTGFASDSPPTGDGGDGSPVEDRFVYLKRWLRVWIALLVVATLVIVGYLIVIAMSLSDANANIAAAERAVRTVRGNVSILPGQINTVNSHLAGIDRDLDEVPERVKDVNRSLTTVRNTLSVTDESLAGTARTLPITRDSLVATDRVLKSINASLQTTNGSLKDTGSLLASVSTLAGQVEVTLEDTESPPNRLDGLSACPTAQESGGSICIGRVSEGAEGIFERVAVANSVLVPVRRDTGNILGSLTEVNEHLISICESPVLQPLGGFPPC